MVVNGKLSVEKIIDYSEYESMYGSFHGEFVSFYDHIRLRSDKSIEHEYRYLSQGAISFAEKFQKTAIDILIFRPWIFSLDVILTCIFLGVNIFLSGKDLTSQIYEYLLWDLECLKT